MMEEFVRPRNTCLDHVIRIMLVAVLKRLLTVTFTTMGIKGLTALISEHAPKAIRVR